MGAWGVIVQFGAMRPQRLMRCGSLTRKRLAHDLPPENALGLMPVDFRSKVARNFRREVTRL